MTENMHFYDILSLTSGRHCVMLFVMLTLKHGVSDVTKAHTSIIAADCKVLVGPVVLFTDLYVRLFVVALLPRSMIFLNACRIVSAVWHAH